MITLYASPTTPQKPKLLWFGLFRFRSPLLTESLFVFSSSGYLDVSVPQVCLSNYRDISNFIGIGFPIRKSTDQFVLTNPRSLSQFLTSFIASESLGIPHTLLFFFLKIVVKYNLIVNAQSRYIQIFLAFTFTIRQITNVNENRICPVFELQIYNHFLKNLHF